MSGAPPSPPDFATALALLQLARPNAPTLDEATVDALLDRRNAPCAWPDIAPPTDPQSP